MVKPNDGRARRLALWLLNNADLINAPEKLQITFNCSGRGGTVELKNRLILDTSELKLSNGNGRAIRRALGVNDEGR